MGSLRTSLAAVTTDTPAEGARLTFREVFDAGHARLAAGQIVAGSMRTFVYGVCLRVAADFRRRAYRHRERLYADPPEASSPARQEDALANREALELMEAALSRLPAPQRDAFVLYEIEELDMADVAAALGCPLQTAYSRLHAARKAVMVALDAWGDIKPMGASGGRNR